MNQLYQKCENLETSIAIFQKKLQVLNRKGLLELINIKNELISLTKYQDKLTRISQDKSKFARIERHVTGKEFTKTLDFNLFISHEVRHIFVMKPTF